MKTCIFSFTPDGWLLDVDNKRFGRISTDFMEYLKQHYEELGYIINTDISPTIGERKT